MTEPLFPAAQAVLDAIHNGKSATDRYNILYRWVASAALEAVADQVVPEEEEPVPNEDSVVEMQVWARVSQRQRTRSRLLAIAAELKGHQ